VKLDHPDAFVGGEVGRFEAQRKGEGVEPLDGAE
jgi:hypothetical protein